MKPLLLLIAAVGLALIITIYRHFKTANVDKVEEMKG